MPERVLQNTALRAPLQAYLSSDHVTPATGKTIAVTLSKNGGAYANPSGGATNAVEVASGSYYVDLTATDTNTPGPLWVRGTCAGVDDVVEIYDVVSANVGGVGPAPPGLTDLPTVKAHLNIDATNTSQDAWLGRLLAGANAAVVSYCKRNLETQGYTDYLSGNGLQSLPCRQRPVLLQSLTGTLSNGSAVVTALASTSTLYVGASTSGSGVPAGTTVLSVDSSTQVTLSNKATASGATALAFGPAVWLDPAGWGGRGPNAFSTASLLREGYDWLLDYGADGNLSSKSGNLLRLGGGISGTTLDAIWPWEWRKGTLTVRLPPVWPAGLHNVKVQYRAGFGNGPAATGGSLPEDLTLAANMVVAWLRRAAKLGAPVQSESLAGYSYAVAQPQAVTALRSAPDLGEVRQLLSRYRELAF